MNLSEEKPNYTRFDRHSIFNEEDRKLVIHLTDAGDLELQNKLYGLFDGYLYNDLLVLAEDQLTDVELDSLKTLVGKIKNG